MARSAFSFFFWAVGVGILYFFSSFPHFPAFRLPDFFRVLFQALGFVVSVPFLAFLSFWVVVLAQAAV